MTMGPRCHETNAPKRPRRGSLRIEAGSFFSDSYFGQVASLSLNLNRSFLIHYPKLSPFPMCYLAFTVPSEMSDLYLGLAVHLFKYLLRCEGIPLKCYHGCWITVTSLMRDLCTLFFGQGRLDLKTGPGSW